MSNVYLWKITIIRESTEEALKEFHLMGRTVLQVSHLADHLVEDHMDEFDNDSVIVSGVEKVKGVVIANFECPENGISDLLDDDEDMGEYMGTEPVTAAERMSDEHVVKFKCGECKEEIRVAGLGWPFILCPHCELKINRADIHQAGGIYYYEKFEPKKK
jgi:hypothetical protein